MPGGRRLKHLHQQHSPQSAQGHWHTSMLSTVQLFATLWTVAHQAPLSMGFSRQEYWSGLPFPSLEDLPSPGIKPVFRALAGWLFITETLGKTTIPLKITAIGLTMKKNEKSELNSIIQQTNLKRPEKEFCTHGGRGTLCCAFCLFSESAYYQHLQINSNYQIKVVILIAW